jgi:hypothetical protein
MQSSAAVRAVGIAMFAMACHSQSVDPSRQTDGPLFDGGGGPSYVTFSVRGMTFTSSGGFSTDHERPNCSTSLLGWITSSGIPPYKYTHIRTCQAIPPGGGGEYLNGGQVQVNGVVGTEYGYLASVPGNLLEDFTTIDYPSNGTVEFYGQAADGNCTFDQWRISTGGPVTSSTQNPMTITPLQGHQIVGWFICSAGGGGGWSP